MNFVVHRTRLSQTATVQSPALALLEGDILVEIVKFAFTANNVSYAATGEALGYWKFFPCDYHEDDDASNNQWGRVPVWGVGVIVASRCSHGGDTQQNNYHSNSSLQGRRIYGYFPMSHYVILRPSKMTHVDFVDGAVHRRTLPAIYNQYFFCDEDPFYTPRIEDAMMVLRPLFLTSWLLLDFFLHSPRREKLPVFWGATTIILSSASSKTSIGLAFLLKQYKEQQQPMDGNGERLVIVGLTSARNLDMVRQLDLYDNIITYNDMERQINATQPSCFVDMAGNTGVTTRLHSCLRHNMKYSCLVGVSHVGQGGKPHKPLQGAHPKFFFAPTWTAQRSQELGGSHHMGANKRRGLQILLNRVLLDYTNFVEWCLMGTAPKDGRGQWLKMQYYFGPTAVKQGYDSCLHGHVGPDTAIIMSLCPSQSNSLSHEIARL